MGGGDFHNAGAKSHVDVFVGNDRNLASNQGQSESFAHKFRIALVLWVDRNSGIAKEGFGTGGGELKPAGTVCERIAEMPKMACLILIFHLSIGDGGFALGAPVDYALTAVDEALFIELTENLAYGGGASLVQSEALSLPVTGAAELFELLDNGSAVIFLPFPGSFEEAVTAHVLFCEALGAHVFNDFYLGGNGSMISTRHPECLIALHTFHADEHVLNGLVQCVAHVKFAGNIWRWNNNGERFFIRIYLGVEISAVQPELVYAALHLRGVIGFVKFSAHLIFSFS